MQPVHGSHDLSLVTLSLIIAFMASLTAIDTARRVHFSVGWRRVMWLVSGSAAMGIGIWSMHFIAMLAFKLSVPVTYDKFLVAVSIVVAIVASLCGLYYSTQQSTSNAKLIIGGIIMGIGICGMHYIGMAAMKGVQVTYDPLLFTLSIFIAIGASVIALMLAFQFRDSENGISNRAKVVSGVVMGSAIAGLHYTGMAAASYAVDPVGVEKVTSTMIDTSQVVIAVTISTIIILGIVLVISFGLDRRLDEEIAFKGAILESVLDCVIIVDRWGKIIECNPSVTNTFGYWKDKLIGLHMADTLLVQPSPIISRDGHFRCNERLEAIGVRSDGTEFPVELTITRIKKDGAPIYTVYVRDITSVKEAENMIKELAYHDSLTGLPNRRFFNENIDETLREAEQQYTKFAVLYLDLDRFKVINDSKGHTFGDLLLVHVARRLTWEVGNRGIVFRNGGDEFTIVLKDTTDQETEQMAEAIIESLSRPLRLNDDEMFITISIGIAMYPKDGKDGETLVKNADIALYDAKDNGRNRYAFYRATSFQNIQYLQMENELRLALEREELLVHYQPKMDIQTGKIVGVEALVRWMHPEKGMVPPCAFIPYAEASGLIVPIGEKVLRMAVAQGEAWRKSLFPMQVSVNLSAGQFQKRDMVKRISEILEETGADPTFLNLEITESMMMDVDYSLRLLKDLKTLGVTISIDDFGTGYNSLLSLKEMPIDDIKIDKSFMDDVPANHENGALVKAIISIGQSLKMNVIAEGVENEEQLAFLKTLGCHQMQGYLLSPPLPAEELEKLIVSRKNSESV